MFESLNCIYKYCCNIICLSFVYVINLHKLFKMTAVIKGFFFFMNIDNFIMFQPIMMKFASKCMIFISNSILTNIALYMMFSSRTSASNCLYTTCVDNVYTSSATHAQTDGTAGAFRSTVIGKEKNPKHIFSRLGDRTRSAGFKVLHSTTSL